MDLENDHRLAALILREGLADLAERERRTPDILPELRAIRERLDAQAATVAASTKRANHQPEHGHLGEKAYLSRSEAAAYAGVSVRQIDRWISNEGLDRIKHGEGPRARVMIRREVLDAFMKAREAGSWGETADFLKRRAAW